MFCSSCGAESTIGLNYCKRCGANLSSSGEERRPGTVPFSVVALFGILIAFLGLIGVLAVVEGGGDLARSGMGENMVIPVVVCGTGVVLGIAAMLVWLLMKLLSSYGASPPARKSKKSLPPAIPAQLMPEPRGVASVTEHTTRHFEPAKRTSADTADMD